MTLLEKLTPEQLKAISEKGRKFPNLVYKARLALTKSYVIDLTIDEAIVITSIFGKSWTDIYEVLPQH